MKPSDVFPDLRPWVVHLADVFPATIIKPQFASWEVLHIVSLIILGGASILMNLRLIGVGITNETPSEVHRNLRTWLNVGVVGIIVSGLLIGTANAERLYDSAAFTVKMSCLLAGIILTYGATGLTAKHDGRVTNAARLFLILGLAIFAFAVWVFITSDLINPGIFHVITAGALVAAIATRGRLRWIYLTGLVALIAVQFVSTHIIVKPDDYAHLDPVNLAFGWIFTGWIVGCSVVQLFLAGRGPEGGPLTKTIGYVSILVWVAAAAAGRWIAFA